MKQELEVQLVSEFPSFFRGYEDGDPRQTLMVFGFECGDGWFGLIHKLCEDIRATNPPEDFCAVQVKEKFGGLRFYVRGGTHEIIQLIDDAEKRSYHTCESCGLTEGVTTQANPGKYWIRSLCPNCRKETE